MKIYNYHYEYGYFTNDEDAFESPLEPGVYLIPACATEIPIPEYSEGTIPVFDGNKWNIVNDNRGIWYKTTTGEEYTIYNPLEETTGLIRIKPPEITSSQTISWDGEKWIVEDVPPPLPLTPEQKLQNAGLTIEELKSLLGL